ncbi:MKI67 FHA domain-interacting nucleolar phosphoprotein isoform X1 [Peromyscus californicus insignis]|uniref:MKI67 FHA domain-interacting nucleolar phosphoprotein isoform X1 n=1 Tax=Peromyscus californicus insignis TaxID=564181 RepID=UPI0022A72648|nr:MKI67 FHA domain-interacting nucleolar phosphoprotein isoform X1 [Peromyscus californicus insignis]
MAVLAAPSEPSLALNPLEDSKFQEQLTQIQQRVKKQKKGENLKPGVIFLGHLPSTLNESHIYDYFTQFGTINRFRLSRSKRTGNSRGYAFVEFESEDVAKIVAETMDNYLFGERLLSCKFLPPEKVHKELFKQWNVPFEQPSFPAVKRYNQKRGHLQMLKMECRFKKKEKLLRKKLAKKGIDYSFPSLVLPKLKKGTSKDTLSTPKNAEDSKVTQVSPTPRERLSVVPRKKEKKMRRRIAESIRRRSKNSKKSVDSEGPTPICTPTFLERRKSQVTEINDDKDNEIIFKQPVPTVNEEGQKTPTPARSVKKRPRKRKSNQ